MGILDRLFNSSDTRTKQPTFNVSQFVSNNTFQNLIDKSDNRNYLDQYILYVYRCIELISDTMINSQPKVVDKDGTEIEDIDILKDLEHFNPYQTLNEARKIREAHLRLTGIAAWVLQPSDNPRHKYDFFILEPTKLDIKTDSYGLPSYYQYEDGDGIIRNFEPEELIYFKRPHPKNWLEGYSQLEPIKFLANAFSAGSQMNMNRLLNNGMPDFLLWFGQQLDEEQQKKLESNLRSKYGGTKNAGRQGIFTSREKPERIDLSNTNKDLQYIEGMKMMRQDILAMFGVPEALIFPSATNANTKESMRMFQQTTIRPALVTEFDTLNEQLLPKYYGDVDIQDKIEFIFDDPVDQDRLEDSEVTRRYVESGIITRNEARRLAGFDEVPDGDVYLVGDKQKPEDMPQPENEDETKALAEISHKIAKIEDNLLQDSKKAERELLKQKALETAISEENELKLVTVDVFKSQATRFLDKYDSKKPTLRTLPDKEEENDTLYRAFAPKVIEQATRVNADANVEIKQKLYKLSPKKFLEYKTKSLTATELAELEKYLQRFANELNETTLKKFKTLIANGIKEGFDVVRYRQAIADMFNGYIDGEGNIATLRKFNVYEEAITITTDGEHVLNSNNRFNAMFEGITKNLKGEDQKEALRALKGVIDTSDPLGQQVDNLISSMFGVKDISESRVATIARTTSTYARNFSFNKTYNDNPFVTGREWLSAHDDATRDAHAEADGQVVQKEDPFIVGGEKLMFPGDPAGSAENVINCRCRIVASVE